MRYKGGEVDAVRIPWIVEAMYYEVMEGLESPSHCQASWELEEGTWTWLEMIIDHLEYKK